MNKLETSVGPLRLSNPVMPASGCFGPELGTLIDLNRLGALVTKTVFARPRSGNPAHRLHETEAGMLNSVGIPSRGLEFFITETLPEYRRFAPPTIVSIGGLSVADFWDIAERLRNIPGIAALEVNISCPNLEAGGLEIGGNPKTVEAVIRGVVDRSNVPTIAKLTPNVTSIAWTILSRVTVADSKSLVIVRSLQDRGLSSGVCNSVCRALMKRSAVALSSPSRKSRWMLTPSAALLTTSFSRSSMFGRNALLESG